MNSRGIIGSFVSLFVATVVIVLILVVFAFGSKILVFLGVAKSGGGSEKAEVYYSPKGYLSGDESTSNGGWYVAMSRYMRQPDGPGVFVRGKDILKPQSIYVNGEWIFGGGG